MKISLFRKEKHIDLREDPEVRRFIKACSTRLYKHKQLPGRQQGVFLSWCLLAQIQLRPGLIAYHLLCRCLHLASKALHPSCFARQHSAFTHDPIPIPPVSMNHPIGGSQALTWHLCSRFKTWQVQFMVGFSGSEGNQRECSHLLQRKDEE